MTDSVTTWLISYGPFALFFFLALGIVGIPFPDETILITAGWLIAKGDLSIPFTVIAAIAGSCCGISLSYLLGSTTGSYLVKKYGYWIGITSRKVRKTRIWFKRIGKWILVIGYYIPLARHLTGYVAGTTRLPFRYFALFAYSGAALWTATFLALGYFFGKKADLFSI